jgi:hypothetical protein
MSTTVAEIKRKDSFKNLKIKGKHKLRKEELCLLLSEKNKNR